MRKLSYKIGLGYFVIIVINIMIAVFAVYHINQLSTPINEILKEKYQKSSANTTDFVHGDLSVCSFSFTGIRNSRYPLETPEYEGFWKRVPVQPC